MRILFISNETSRTGAPMMLLYLMQTLKKKGQHQISFLSLADGDMSDDFKKASDQFFLPKQAKKGLFKKALDKIKQVKPSKIDRMIKGVEALDLPTDFDLIYANTIITIPVANYLKDRSSSARLLVHVHELGTMIKLKLPDFKSYIPKIDKVIAASELVKKNLIDEWGLATDKVSRVYECSMVGDVEAGETNTDGSFTVGASGTVNWRKGYDNFIQVANYLKLYHPQIDIKFIWVGAIKRFERTIIEADLKKMGLFNSVEFTGQTDQPAHYFKDMDLFLMTSREDPFPLVCIEVGMMGKPIICFDGATGTEEIVQDKGGKIVPYLDIRQMAETVLEYYNDAELVKQHGDYNREAFREFSPEKISLQIERIIEDLVE